MKVLKFAAVLLFAAWIPSIMAQSGSTAALTGTVTDATGAVVPNVTVMATNTGTNRSRTVTTGADGVYSITLLEPGPYRVRFTAQGFKAAEVGSVTLTVTETVSLDRSLEVGSQTDQVTVEASVETIQTATSTLGTTVTGSRITALPLATRNFTQVLGMSTGVAGDVANGAGLGRGSQNMSVNGAAPEKNNFQMDGVPINNAAGNNNAGDAGLYTGIATPNPDAIQEFKIQTSTYDASFGRNPGANVNVVTKSGTNQIHGSLFEFFRNEALNAHDIFYNRDNPNSRVSKQVLKQNQFGGTIGGPIKKDKLFYFGSYQGTRQRNGVAGQGYASVTLFPIPGNRETSDFTQRLGAATCGFVPTRGIRIACDGSNINPVAVNLLRVKLPDGSYYIPSSGTSGTATRLYSYPAKFSEDQYIANTDYVLSEKNNLQMKYMFTKDPYTYTGQPNPSFSELPGRFVTDNRSNTSAVLRWTSIVTSNFLNEARGSFQRVLQDGNETVPYTAQQVGIKPLIDITCCNGTTLGTYTHPPRIDVGGAFILGGDRLPQFAPSNQTQWADQISWTHGKQTLRAGFEYENVRYPLVYAGLGVGSLIVPSFADLLIGRAGCQPAAFQAGTCSLANPGNTNGSTLSNLANCLFCVRSPVQGIIHSFHLHNISTFVQDDWKVTSKLMVNLGVRWEYDGALSDKYGNLTNFWASDLRSVAIPPSAPSQTDPNAFIGYVVPSNYDPRPISQGGKGPLPPGIRQDPGESTTQNGVPLNNFAPRLGFAWQTSQRLVVRGGVGMFYDRVGINRLVHAVNEGRPYADTTGIQNEIASLQSPFQDRPLAFLPRWFNFNTLTGSSFNSPFYDVLHTPLVRQYNLGFQYEFASSFVLEAAFVGSSGINMTDYNHNINPARLVCTTLVTSSCVTGNINGITTNTAANAAARVPYLGYLPNGLQQNGFDGVSNYSSMQVTVRKNFTRGLGFQAAYTWSKNLSNVAWDAANINLSTDLAQQYGQTPYSRPHRFIFNYQYELPFKAKGMLDKVVGGWTVSGLTTIQSGNPLTLFDNRGGTVYGTPGSGTVENGLSRAALCPGFTYDQIETSGNVKDRLGSSGGTRFFNTAAFNCSALPVMGNDGSLGFGNTGVGIVRGPHQLNFDFQAGKILKIGEKQTVQFRAEFFNIFNHAQFAIPGYTTQAPFANNGPLFTSGTQLGVISQTSVAPRLIQFALKYSF
jgi:hypothetical protein